MEHYTVDNLKNIKNEVELKKSAAKIIAVSKTFSLDKILPLVEYGHLDFGENKVQEAVDKWSGLVINKANINLHMIGKLQSNKVKQAVKIFTHIHSLDTIKLAQKISNEQSKINKNLKIFIQINIGDESQKSGINIDDLPDFYKECVNDLNLNIIGLMCLPPANKDTSIYFEKMLKASKDISLSHLSMGMSSDYLGALDYNASYIRIGSKIFGERN